MWDRHLNFHETRDNLLILHLNREVMHHGAEIALLRDLYRAGLGRG